MSHRPRKSSACVTLVLIGAAAALSGCGADQNANRRATYATKEACLADWGDPKDCEQRQATGSGGARSHYWGPSTGAWNSYSSSRGSSSSGGHSISRGGFGSHGSSSS
jgi:uncharacterized protein YgiB involved in biofilm formation